jgi:glycosyltransferase involved in cell wall biosynthesis
VTTVSPRHEQNLEGIEDYDITWRWSDRQRSTGMTAVMRVKNEARSLPWVLPGLLRSVERIVLIDNESTDGTPDVAQRIAKELDRADHLAVFSYPFAVSRCGSEHLHTPAESVHSLTYFYNWSFSQVDTHYALKWDGDMVLTYEGERVLRDLSWQFEAADAVMPIPRIPVYVESPDVAYLDLGIEHYEPCGWPNTPQYRFAKGFEWEVPVRPDNVPVRIMPGNICFELKWLDGDEFANWTGNDFVTSERATRKQRDWRLFTALNNGEQPDELHRIERGSAPHVIEKIRRTRRAEYEAMTASFWDRVGLTDRL